MEPERAGAILPQRRQDDGCGHCHAAEFLCRASPRCSLRDRTCRPQATFPNYDVSPDGQRFLMLKPSESAEAAPTQINVVLNWFEELKQKVPPREEMMALAVGRKLGSYESTGAIGAWRKFQPERSQCP